MRPRFLATRRPRLAVTSRSSPTASITTRLAYQSRRQPRNTSPRPYRGLSRRSDLLLTIYFYFAAEGQGPPAPSRYDDERPGRCRLMHCRRHSLFDVSSSASMKASRAPSRRDATMPASVTFLKLRQPTSPLYYRVHISLRFMGLHLYRLRSQPPPLPTLADRMIPFKSAQAARDFCVMPLRWP